MNQTKRCKRVVLAGTEGCQVLYCPDCEIAELEIGEMNIRLEDAVFRKVVCMMNSASKTLENMQGVLGVCPLILEGGRVH